MKHLFIIVSVCLIVSCASTNTKFSAAQLKKVENLVDSTSFEIESNWANPRLTAALLSLQNFGFFNANGNSVSSINISGHSNYFKMNNDSVEVSLPYFGERQMGGRYGSTDNGVVIKGKVDRLKKYKMKNGSYKIVFSVNDANYSTENYDLMVQVFPNMSTNIMVNSSHRTPIQYKGRVLDRK